ncbi:MAG TPA: hypothetical protein VHP11_09525 [Tepidisphaeraceae bacterium]|nr:hypothetical protein [Tepidisphaeraceae bacterium]
MLPTSWHWWLTTDAGLAARVALGVLFFATLALVDLLRHGQNAHRWREYLFLLVCALAAMLYGLINDQITATISWEYFYYGKGLDQVLGPQTPPNLAQLHGHVAKIGLKASWTVGLIAGVAMLLANNPRKDRPQLPYRTLLRLLPLILTAAILAGVVLGLVGRAGGLAWCSADFPDLIRQDLFRPYRLMTVFGIHLGAYVGGLLGTLMVVALILRRRLARSAMKAPDNK